MSSEELRSSPFDPVDEPCSPGVEWTRSEVGNTERLYAPKPQLKGARQSAPRNRSFTQFEGITKAVLSIAANRIEMVTFSEDPLPDAEGTERMLADAWKATEVACGIDEDRTSRIDSFVGNISDIMQWTLIILTQLRSI